MTKESVYGWYPSVRNVYENSQAVKGHEREALFRYYKQQCNRDPPDTPDPWRTVSSAGATPSNLLNGGLTVTKAPMSPRASVRGSIGNAAYRAKSAPANRDLEGATRSTNSQKGSRKDSIRSRVRPATSKSENSKRVNVGTIHRPVSAMSGGQSKTSSARPDSSPFLQAREAYAQRFSSPTPAEGLPAPSNSYEIPFAPPMRNIPTPNLSDYEFNTDTPKPTIEFHIDTPPPVPCPEIVTPQSPNHQNSLPQTPESNSMADCKSGLPRPPTGPASASQTRANSRASRVQSATVRRERSAIPPRPVKSACGQRTPSTVPSEIKVPSTPGPKAVSAPCINVEPSDTVNASNVDPRNYVKQYEEMVKQYGWRAEVHGNPLKVKKVIPRLAYTKKCEEPKMRPEPPRFHWQNYDTYFQNTIPYKPMSFTIHPHFVSETLNAKRMELQKREGIKYRYKDYAFHY